MNDFNHAPPPKKMFRTREKEIGWSAQYIFIGMMKSVAVDAAVRSPGRRVGNNNNQRIRNQEKNLEDYILNFFLHLLYLKVYIYRAMTPSLLLLLLLFSSSFSIQTQTPPGYKFQIPRYCGKKPMALCVGSSARLSSFSLSLCSCVRFF